MHPCIQDHIFIYNTEASDSFVRPYLSLGWKAESFFQTRMSTISVNDERYGVGRKEVGNLLGLLSFASGSVRRTGNSND